MSKSIGLPLLTLLALQAFAPAALADQSLTLDVGQTLHIAGNCPGDVSLAYESDGRTLDFMVLNERCSEIISDARTGRLDGSANSFDTDQPIVVKDGDIVQIKGKKAGSAVTSITINAPTSQAPVPPAPIPAPVATPRPPAPAPTATPRPPLPAPSATPRPPAPVPVATPRPPAPAPIAANVPTQYVPAIGGTLNDAQDACTKQLDADHPTLGLGNVIGRSYYASHHKGDIAIVCDRGGVFTPALGESGTMASYACSGESVDYTDLGKGVRLGLSAQITDYVQYVVVCKRVSKPTSSTTPFPVTVAPPPLPSARDSFPKPSTVQQASQGWITLSTAPDACGGRVRLAPSGANADGTQGYQFEIQGSACSKVGFGYSAGDTLNSTGSTAQLPLTKKAGDAQTLPGYGLMITVPATALPYYTDGNANEIAIVLLSDSRDDSQKPAFEPVLLAY